MALTTIATLPPAVQEHFDDKLLAVHVPNLIYGLGVARKDMPANAGNFMKMGRYSNFPLALTPLSTDGSTPPAVTTTRTDILAEIQFFGLHAAINERVTLFNNDPVLNSFSNLMGISLRRTEDALIRDVILSSATFVRSTGGNNGDLATNISPSDVDDVVAALMGSDAMMLMQQEGGQDRFGSSPISDGFLGLCHTDLIPSLNSMADFTKKANYSNPDAALQRSEWGTISNGRVMVSSQGSQLPNASALGNTV